MSNWENQLINALEAQNQFIVASVNKQTGEMSIANKPKIHTDAYQAKQEANRLAASSKSKKFVVLQVVSVHSVVEIEVTNRL